MRSARAMDEGPQSPRHPGGSVSEPRPSPAGWSVPGGVCAAQLCAPGQGSGSRRVVRTSSVPSCQTPLPPFLPLSLPVQWYKRFWHELPGAAVPACGQAPRPWGTVELLFPSVCSFLEVRLTVRVFLK